MTRSPAARAARAASLVSVDVAGSTVPGALTGIARDHARGMVEAALETLDRLGDRGWRTVAGDPPGRVRGTRGARRRDRTDRILRPVRIDARPARLTLRRRPRRAGAGGSGPCRRAIRTPRGASAFGSSASNSSASQVAKARSTSAGSPTRRSRDGAMSSAGSGPKSRSIASGTRTAVDAQPSRDWKATVGKPPIGSRTRS